SAEGRLAWCRREFCQRTRLSGDTLQAGCSTRLLRACRGDPRQGAAEKRDEIAPPHCRSPCRPTTCKCPLRTRSYHPCHWVGMGNFTQQGGGPVISRKLRSSPPAFAAPFGCLKGGAAVVHNRSAGRLSGHQVPELVSF